ncbi:MAG: hypothetical protein NTX40_07750 [Planctomycetota bacterium]|nr:hypothetical protein [Planctomycetota bacterium]
MNETRRSAQAENALLAAAYGLLADTEAFGLAQHEEEECDGEADLDNPRASRCAGKPSQFPSASEKVVEVALV